MWSSAPAASPRSSMPAAPKYSSTQAWKAVPLRADIPGSRGTAAGGGPRRSLRHPPGPRVSTPKCGRADGRPGPPNAGNGVPAGWPPRLPIRPQDRAGLDAVAAGAGCARAANCSLSKLASKRPSVPVSIACRTRAAADSMAARLPVTSRSRFPVRGSIRPLKGVIGPDGDFEFQGQGAFGRQSVLADGQRVDFGSAFSGEALQPGKKGRHLSQTSPGSHPRGT